MKQAITTVEAILMGRILNNVPSGGKVKARSVLLTVTGLLFFCAFIIFSYAAILYITDLYSPQMSTVIVGSFVLMLGGISAIGTYAFLRYRRSKIETLKQEIIEMLQSGLDLLDDEISKPIQNNPKTSVFIAALAGFIAGEKMI